MLRYVLKRILLLIPVIVCVSFIVFALMELAPGDIIAPLITEHSTEEDIAALRAMYNLDRSMFYRYGLYMFNLIQGDLGVSDVSGLSVWDTYISRLPNTLYLSFAALVIGSSISVPMGISAAKRAGRIADTATTTFTLVGMSMPGFWLGLLLLLVFSHHLGWLPAGGNREGIRSFILPAICSGLLLMATATRQTRSSMLEVLKADYLRTARAKGVPEEKVIRKHALGNAWIPILTTIGTAMGVSLAGSAVIETVFAWPGVGRMTVDAVVTRDVTTISGCIIMTTILYVLLQLIVDLLYAFVDPRIKTQYAGGGKKKKLSAVVSASALAPSGMRQEAQPAADDCHMQSDQKGFAIEGQVPAREAEPLSPTPEEQPEKGTSFVTRMSIATGGQSSVMTGADEGGVSGEAKELIVNKYRKRSQLAEIFHSIRRNKSAMAGLIIIAALFLTAIVSLPISYESVTEINAMARFHTPSREYLFGTDNMGRDMFLRTIYGTRYSIVIAFGATGIATVLGVILGSLAGYFGKVADEVIMRASDVLASIPGLLLGMVIVTVLGQSLQNLIIAVGITTIPIFIRITRASILTVRSQEFVEAARAIGLSNIRIIFAQVLPNGLSPIIVTFTASLGLSIIVAASLSFLGFGVPVPTPEWGSLVSAGRDFIRTSPHLTTFPGLFIMITVLAFNLLGDGLRDALDPKLKR